MPERDWEKELAEIDRRISTAPEEPRGVAVPGGKAPATAPRAGAGQGPTVVTAPRRTWKTTAALLFRLVLAAVLVACIVVWPYDTRCGIGLAAYVATIAVAGLASLWTSVAAWRHRSAALHVLGLSLLLASGVYAAREVLPRVGYALPDPLHPTIWVCQ
jgi:hypothetical protein